MKVRRVKEKKLLEIIEKLNSLLPVEETIKLDDNGLVPQDVVDSISTSQQAL